MYSIKSFCDEYCSKKNIKMYPIQEDILNQFYAGGYRELVAVLGRRGGKDFLLSLIAVYETIQLLELENPYEYYGLASGNPIYNMAISASSDQARILFCEIKGIVMTIDKLRDRIDTAGTKKAGSESIQFKTAGGVPVILSVHSCKSESLLGKRIYSLLVSDLARDFDGWRIYAALTPSTADFINPKTGKLDSKIVTISSPNDSIHKLYSTADEHDRRLAVKYATWEISEIFTEAQLKKEFKFMSDEEFAVEFGAEFLPDMKNETVSFRLSGPTLNTLKRLARKIAFKEDKDYTYVDLIRSSIRNEIVRCMEV